MPSGGRGTRTKGRSRRGMPRTETPLVAEATTTSKLSTPTVEALRSPALVPLQPRIAVVAPRDRRSRWGGLLDLHASNRRPLTFAADLVVLTGACTLIGVLPGWTAPLWALAVTVAGYLGAPTAIATRFRPGACCGTPARRSRRPSWSPSSVWSRAC